MSGMGSFLLRAGLTGLNDNQKIEYELQSGRDGRASASDLKLL